jgi:endoglucanase
MKGTGMNIQKTKPHFRYAAILFFLAAAGLLLPACSGTAVGNNGRLQVIGGRLCNDKGEPVQLKGMILLDVLWVGDYVNPGAFAWLRDNWGCSLIRAALYTERDGHFRAPEGVPKMKEAVQAAMDTGLYIIIDWHILYDGNPMKYKEQAVDFFRQMASLYKDVPNVLYEICSEPNGDDVTWEGVVKPYAEEVIGVIRAIDPDNVILVGTPTWSQRVDIAADDPLEFDNIMYTCHFYAGSHYSDLRDKITYAMDKGAAVFVTEWGTTQSSGTGVLYPEESYAWIDFMNQGRISWADWAITTRNESSAALRFTAASDGGWNDGDLTESGLFVRSLIRGQDTDIVLFADGFETENLTAGGWETENPSIDRNEASQGYVSAVLKQQSSITKLFATQPFKNIRLQFSYKTENWNTGDGLTLEWYDGSSWQALKKLEPSPGWNKTTVSFPPEADDNYDFAFRFVSAFGSADTLAWLDEVALVMDRKQ